MLQFFSCTTTTVLSDVLDHEKDENDTIEPSPIAIKHQRAYCPADARAAVSSRSEIDDSEGKQQIRKETIQVIHKPTQHHDVIVTLQKRLQRKRAESSPLSDHNDVGSNLAPITWKNLRLSKFLQVMNLPNRKRDKLSDISSTDSVTTQNTPLTMATDNNDYDDVGFDASPSRTPKYQRSPLVSILRDPSIAENTAEAKVLFAPRRMVRTPHVVRFEEGTNFTNRTESQRKQRRKYSIAKKIQPASNQYGGGKGPHHQKELPLQESGFYVFR